MASCRGMTAEERYLFDLNGYLVVRGALSGDEVRALNAAIDEHKHEAIPRSSEALRNAGRDTAFGERGVRRDLGGMLSWETDAFRQLLAHPSVAPYLVEFCGEGYRLDHQPLVLLQDSGSEGFALHGGPLSGDDGVSAGVFNPELQYRCVNGQPWTSLLAMAVHLVDAPEGAGGFCVVRGSHKANFAVPVHFASGDGDGSDFAAEFACQPQTRAGDVLFFSEATVHGAKPWRQDYERRLALYRFAPANFAYGRGYLADWGGPDVLDKCTPAQRAVLEPPFAPRLERTVTNALGDLGQPRVKPRSSEKKEHDKAVFKSDFF
ncbi:hypothetical protein CTAYLR_005267 [Chrysophaeum taylorii]|uniref:Phytanoyl-CoA dioxygenase family protein n=1 Tax=Chrysophaeum taylorii TaxID=2483200 RepID=A0AAD7XLB9_9STRA|nr:hypothetical protein CTAYLR_005267 [Chrysophaeum taylorii]